MRKSDDIPVCFDVKEDVDGCRIIKVSCIDVDGSICKEETVNMTNNSPKELSVLWPEESLATPDRFGWFGATLEGNKNAKVKHILQHLGRPLNEMPQKMG